MGRSIVVGAMALLGTLALNAVPVAAKTGYLYICPSLGTPLCEPLEAALAPRMVAVDNSGEASAGNVWVTYGLYQKESVRLVQFSASGERVGEAEVSNLPGSARPIVAQAGRPRPVAVDPMSGAVYLGSEGAVTKFDSSGVFQLQIGATPHGSVEPEAVAVDGSGDLYVADATDRAVDKFSSSGVYLESLPIPVSTSLAIGPEGDLYVGRSDEVRRYSLTGAPVDCPGTGNVLSREGGSLVAVDPSDGHLFVDEASATEGKVIAEYSSFCAAKWSNRFARGEIAYVEGIDVSGATHEIYVDNWFLEGGVVNGFVRVYGLITLPSVATGSASDVTRTSAAVTGTVSPEGAEVTSCEFEYGPTVFYGQTVPCSPVPPFSGGQVAVRADLSFVLPPGSAIHYRLKVGTPAGGEYGEDESFVREAPPTVVGTLPASGVSQVAATLDGTIETGEEIADYHFEYGTSTAYGQLAPIPDSYTPITDQPVTVAQSIVGLQAGTTYHYRLVASSPGGTDVVGPDMTFTTPSVPAPTVTSGAAEVGIDQATLTGTVDPHGWDVRYLFEYGASVEYGQNWPTVEVDMGALEGPQPVVVTVPSLLPGTTYHYRLVATNGAGTSYGPDMTFTTADYPAGAIQEPTTLRTLLVPSEPGKIASTTKKQGKKAGQKHRRATKRKRGSQRKKGRGGKGSASRHANRT